VNLRFIPASGFMARGGVGPRQNNPRDWMAWHFTHVENLPGMAAEGRLLSANAVTPIQDVALAGVKARRARKIVYADEDYPASTVNDHVPFYIAAKSPMLLVVTSGHETYAGGSDPLVFLGVALGDIMDCGATWCVSNGNAAAAVTAFSRDETQVGTFVDFAVLSQRAWYNTPEDQNRKSRRAAELLVLNEVPLELVTVVIAKSEPVLAAARTAFASVGGVRQYHVVREMYY
jgi:ssDNA thymidine ADP-ribosyltransferase, DarT